VSDSGGVNYLLHPPLNPGDLLLWVVGLGLLILKVYAFVDCLRQQDAAFPAHGKLTKPVWLAITGIAALLQLAIGGTLGLLPIIGTVAAIVYFVDVKPAVSGSNNNNW
jgi:hypothetical protein